MLNESVGRAYLKARMGSSKLSGDLGGRSTGTDRFCGGVMRPNEARYVGGILDGLPVDQLSPCLNIGSSTEEFRRQGQPHIHEFIFAPLERRGVEVIHSDLKSEAGVDIAGDIFDAAILGEIERRKPRSALCCNMFEHVKDPERLVSVLTELVPAGGYLIVTVPRSYPIHFDPIDTGFRPSPGELAEMFSAFEVEQSQVVTDTTYGEDLLRDLGALGMAAHLLRSAAKFFMFWRGRAVWVAHFHRYLWLFRPYSVSCVLLRKLA